MSIILLSPIFSYNQSKKHYSKTGEAISNDLSCQLILILWKCMIPMDEEEAEKSIAIDDLPAVTTLENGARVLLRQWKAYLQMLNPRLSTMNWNKQLEDSVIEMDKLGTMDSEYHMETSDGTILDEFPSDGSALYGTRTSIDQSEHTSVSGYNRSQIYSRLQYNMYDEFSDRKRNRNVSGMSEGAPIQLMCHTRDSKANRSQPPAARWRGLSLEPESRGSHLPACTGFGESHRI